MGPIVGGRISEIVSLSQHEQNNMVQIWNANRMVLAKYEGKEVIWKT
jgi:hypothetical protein